MVYPANHAGTDILVIVIVSIFHTKSFLNKYCGSLACLLLCGTVLSSMNLLIDVLIHEQVLINKVRSSFIFLEPINITIAPFAKL